MRVTIGGIMHESMSFSPIRTTLDRLEQHAGDDPISAHRETYTEIGGFLEVAQQEGFAAIHES